MDSSLTATTGLTVPIDGRTLEAAYSCYRAALKIQRNLQSDERAGARKQEALKIASQRYRIPLGQLKREIRTLEAERGIDHEHPESYQRELTFLEAAAELEKQNTGVCPICNGARDMWNLQGDEGPDVVKVRHDPLEAEIHQELEPVLSCLGCWLRLESQI